VHPSRHVPFTIKIKPKKTLDSDANDATIPLRTDTAVAVCDCQNYPDIDPWSLLGCPTSRNVEVFL